MTDPNRSGAAPSGKPDVPAAPDGSGAREQRAGGAIDVLAVARLARLAIEPGRESEVAAEFARILDAFRALEAVDLAHVAGVEGGAGGLVEPMTRPSDATDVLREDRERPGIPAETLLASAPRRVEDFYSVPKTIGPDA